MRRTFSLPAASSSWSAQDLQKLREFARQGASLEAMSAALRRTPSAIRNKAGIHGISLRSGGVGLVSFSCPLPREAGEG